MDGEDKPGFSGLVEQCVADTGFSQGLRGGIRTHRKTKSVSEINRVHFSVMKTIGVQDSWIGNFVTLGTSEFPPPGEDKTVGEVDGKREEIHEKESMELIAIHEVDKVNSGVEKTTKSPRCNRPTQRTEISWRKSNRHQPTAHSHPIVESQSDGDLLPRDLLCSSGHSNELITSHLGYMQQRRPRSTQTTGLNILRKKNVITNKLITFSNDANCSLFLGDRGDLSFVRESDSMILERTRRQGGETVDNDDQVKNCSSEVTSCPAASNDGIDRMVEVTRRWLTEVLMDVSVQMFQYLQQRDLVTAGLSLALGRCEVEQATCRCLIDFMTDGHLREVVGIDDVSSLNETIRTSSPPVKGWNKLAAKSHHWQIACLKQVEDRTPKSLNSSNSTNTLTSCAANNESVHFPERASFKVIRNFVKELAVKHLVLKSDVCNRLLLWLDAADSIFEISESVRAINNHVEEKRRTLDSSGPSSMDILRSEDDVSVSMTTNFSDAPDEKMCIYFFAEIFLPPRKDFSRKFDRISPIPLETVSNIESLNSNFDLGKRSGDISNYFNAKEFKKQNSVGTTSEYCISSPFILEESQICMSRSKSRNRPTDRAWSLNKYSFEENDIELCSNEFIQSMDLMPTFSVTLSYCAGDPTLDQLTQTLARHSCIRHMSIIRAGDLNARQISDVCVALERLESGLVQLDLRMNQLTQLPGRLIIYII